MAWRLGNLIPPAPRPAGGERGVSRRCEGGASIDTNVTDRRGMPTCGAEMLVMSWKDLFIDHCVSFDGLSNVLFQSAVCAALAYVGPVHRAVPQSISMSDEQDDAATKVKLTIV